MSQSFGQRLKQLRCQRGFEQSDVALCTGINEAKLGRFENALQTPVLSEVCALVVALQSKFEEVFSAELAMAKADIHARIADYKPPVSMCHKTANRVDSFRALKAALNAPHGGHC